MFKRIWNTLGNVQLTVWLLFLGTACLLAGVCLFLTNYALIESLDEMPVQAWLGLHAGDHAWLALWLVLLFAVFAVLAVNAVICAIERLRWRWGRRAEVTRRAFLRGLIPSIIHIIFVVMLTGHFLTFTQTYHRRLPVTNGSLVQLPDAAPFQVQDIALDFFPGQTALKDRVRQCQAVLVPGAGIGAGRRIRILEPVRWGAYYIHLDLGRKAPACRPDAVENATVCNRAAVGLQDGSGIAVYVIVTRDPGMNLIMAGFTVVILLMLWYYLGDTRRRRIPPQAGPAAGAALPIP